MRMILAALLTTFATQAVAGETVLTGKVTHVRDGDTIEVNNVPIRLAALDCPERGTKNGDYGQGWQNSFRAYRLPVSLQGPKHTTA